MGYVYANLTNPQNTASGVGEYVLLAPASSFLDDGGIKCPAAPFTQPGDEVTIKEAHEFKTGEGFIKVQLAPQKNQLNGATIGDRGFSKLDLTLDLFIPGSYPIVHEAVKNWLNKPLIAMIKDAECLANMFYQLGCDCASAWLTVDFSTGTTIEGVKGYAGKLNYQNGYVQVYMGPAPTIKGSSSTVTPPSYNKTLTFTTGTDYQADTAGGVGVTIVAAATGDTAKYDSLSSHVGQPLVMSIRTTPSNAATEKFRYEGTTAYQDQGKTVEFTHGGVTHAYPITNGNVQYVGS